MSTLGMELVTGLHCSFPVALKVTNRSQPIVDALVERAEAEEALRTQAFIGREGGPENPSIWVSWVLF